MAIEIKDRFTGVVLFRSEKATTTAEAVQEAYRAEAYRAGANLAGANLAGADLARADLAGANLARANLAGANLAGANLAGANLARANLARADLADQWVIQGQPRSDGYPFFLQRLAGDPAPMVKAGCRYFTLAQAEYHWTKTRGGTKLFAETRAIVRAMVDVMHIRGLK